MDRRAPGAIAADLACIVIFVSIGRRSHEEANSVAEVAKVAVPFLAGAAVGWLVSRGWRAPLDVVPTGVAIWVATVAVGMVLRRTVFDRGVAVSFVIVATCFTGLFLLGWRLVAGRFPAGRSRAS